MDPRNDVEFERFLTDANAFAQRAYGITFEEVEPDLPDATMEMARAMHGDGHSGADFMHAVGIASGFVPDDRAANRALAVLRGYANDTGMAMDRVGRAYKATDEGDVVRMSYQPGVDDGAHFLVETAPDMGDLIFHGDVVFCSHAPDFTPVARGMDPATADAAYREPKGPATAFAM